jgi:cell division protein FtsI/penicillin-binding protein 2
MRAVVTDGTGGALAGIPGGDVFGKTGTAEYGTEDPPETHAWFTGYQGDIAFAVLVENGSFGGTVAAPVAARFLTALAG